MSKRDVRVVAATACLTLAAVVGTWSALPRANAVGETPPAAPIRVLEHNGVRVSLTLEKTACRPGDAPVAILTAMNTQDAPVELEALVTLMTTQPPSPLVRSLPPPTRSWSRRVPIALRPREIRKLELPADVSLAAGTSGTFTLQVGDASLSGPSFAVPGAGVQPLRALVQQAR